MIEWKANTTGNPQILRGMGLLAGTYLCRYRHCGGVMDYMYHCWWKCRQCGRWGRA